MELGVNDEDSAKIYLMLTGMWQMQNTVEASFRITCARGFYANLHESK